MTVGATTVVVVPGSGTTVLVEVELVEVVDGTVVVEGGTVVDDVDVEEVVVGGRVVEVLEVVLVEEEAVGATVVLVVDDVVLVDDVEVEVEEVVVGGRVVEVVVVGATVVLVVDEVVLVDDVEVEVEEVVVGGRVVVVVEVVLVEVVDEVVVGLAVGEMSVVVQEYDGTPAMPVMVTTTTTSALPGAGIVGSKTNVEDGLELLETLPLVSTVVTTGIPSTVTATDAPLKSAPRRCTLQRGYTLLLGTKPEGGQDTNPEGSRTAGSVGGKRLIGSSMT